MPNLQLKSVIKGLAFPNPTNVRITTPGDKTFKVSWVDPNDKDVDHIELSFATPFASISPPPAVNVPLGVGKQTVTVPLNNVWYLITVKAVYKSGDKSGGITPFNILNNQLPYTQKVKQTEDDYYSPASANPVSHLSGDSSSTFTYNPDGTVATSTSYTYSPGKTQNGHASYSYTNGLLTQDTHYNDPGSVNSYYNAYQYDFQGNMIGQSYYSWTGSAWQLSSSQSYTYDASGNQTAAYYYNGSSALQNYQTYQYDASGHVIKETSYSSSNAPQYALAFEWDPATNFPSKFTFYDSTGAVTNYQTIAVQPGSLSFVEYDANGVQTGSGSDSFNSFGLQTGQSQAGSTSSYQWSYDIDGNMLKEVYYGSPGVIDHVYVYTY